MADVQCRGLPGATEIQSWFFVGSALTSHVFVFSRVRPLHVKYVLHYVINTFLLASNTIQFVIIPGGNGTGNSLEKGDLGFLFNTNTQLIFLSLSNEPERGISGRTILDPGDPGSGAWFENCIPEGMYRIRP